MKEKFIASIMLQFLNRIITVLGYFFLVSKLDVGLMGIFAFIISFLNFSFAFVDLGFKSIHYQYSSKPDFNDYFGTYFSIKLILIISNLLSTFILIILFNIWNEEFFVYFLIHLMALIFLKLSDIFISNLRSKKRVLKSELTIFMTYLFLNLSIIIFSLNIDIFHDPLLFLNLIYLVFYFLLFLSLIIVSKRDLYITNIDRGLILNYFQDAKPLVLYSIIYIISEYIGGIIIFYSLGEVSLAYIYIVYSVAINVLVAISNSIIDIYQIYFSHFFKNKDEKSIKFMAYTIEKYFSIGFLSILIVVYLNGELIFSLFLPNYLQALPLLYIMIIIPYLSAINLAYRRQMVPGRKQKPMAIFDTIIRGLTLILMFILIPTEIFGIRGLGWGTLGYAIAMLIPYILMTIGYRVFSYKFFNIRYQKKMILHLILIFPSLFISNWVKWNFLVVWIQNQFLLLTISSILSLAIFFGELFAFKQLKIKDVLLLLEIINLKNMFKVSRDKDLFRGDQSDHDKKN